MDRRAIFIKLMIGWLLALTLVGPAHAVQHFEMHQTVTGCGLCFHGDHQQHALKPSLPTIAAPAPLLEVLNVPQPTPPEVYQAAPTIRGPPLS